MTQDKPFQVIGYGRKSVAEDGSVSLAAQQAEVARWCEARGYTLVAFYADDGVSGATLDRPQFQAAMTHLHSIKGKSRALVSYSLSRLSRSTSDAIRLGQQLDRKGIALVSVSEQIDRSTPHGAFQFELLCSLNALEREIGRARTKTAMGELRRQGRRISRYAPYGYDLGADRKLVINKTEQVIINEMRKMREDGETLDEIATHLDAKGIKTKNGKRWLRTTINRIVKRTEAT